MLPPKPNADVDVPAPPKLFHADTFIGFTVVQEVPSNFSVIFVLLGLSPAKIKAAVCDPAVAPAAFVPPVFKFAADAHVPEAAADA